MGKTIDERVVSMGFENRDFESNAKTSIGTLEKLKQSLKLEGATKGLEEVSSGMKSLNFSPLAEGIGLVQSKFSALEIAGVTALVRITDAAITAGKNMVSALTIDPIKTGFEEYETQVNAVQTILANTASKGANLQDVNRALDELNTYADKTIYNFTEMTRNIGTFTAAGVSLDKSVTSIKGIANLAAVSGSTSQQASTAMYQLSQALAAGKVQLMDWNSVVNAGMGGEVFQNALKRTAKQMGTNVDALIAKEGSFRESLTKHAWLTADVLTETLTQLSGAYTESDLIAKGYTEDQAKEITMLAETAVNAATKVKTFTQLWDTLKEAAQSGWTQSWKIMVGDFEEAKTLLTSISDGVGDVINSSSDARNKMLSEGLSTGWKQILDQGINDSNAFKESIKSVAKEHGVAVDELIESSGSFESSLSSGWVTADILSESISKLTEEVSGLSDEDLKNRGYTIESVHALEKLNEKVKDGSINLEEFAKRMSRQSGRQNMIEGFSNAIQSLGLIMKTFQESFKEFFPSITGEQLYNLTVAFKNFTATLKPSEETLEKLKLTFRGFFAALDLVRYGMVQLLKPFGEMLGGNLLSNLAHKFLDITAAMGKFFVELNHSVKANNSFGYIQDVLSNILKSISGVVDGFIGMGGGVKNGFSKVGHAIGGALNFIKNLLTPLVEWFRVNLTVQNLFAGIVGGSIYGIFKGFKNASSTFAESLEAITERFKGFGFKKEGLNDIKETLGTLQDSLKSFSQGIKVVSLVAIAASVTLLVSAIERLAKLRPDEIASGIVSISAMMTALNLSFKSLAKSMSAFGSSRLISAGVTLMLMAQAIKMLSKAVQDFGQMEWEQLVKGLGGVAVSIAALVKGLSVIKDSKISISTSLSLIALAKACKMLADATQQFAGMSWEDLARGLTGMGGALTELVAATTILGKFSGGGSLKGASTVYILSVSLGSIAKGLQQLGSMSWDSIGKGLAAMTGALAELVASAVILGKFSGFSSISGALSISVMAKTLKDISNNIYDLGNMSWDIIAKGLSGMGAALAELVGASVVLGKFSGFSSIAGSISVAILTKSLSEIAYQIQKLGNMSWTTLAKGLSGIGAALGELVGASIILGKFSGFSSLTGAVSIHILTNSLDEISDNLSKLGSMTWGDIGRGLAAMGGALAELGTVAGVLGSVGSFGSILGSVSIGISSLALDNIAEALLKLSSLSWGDIARGLTAMGGALTELATVSGVLGYLGNFASILGAATLAISSTNIDSLADAFVKLSSLSWDEIQRGLNAMGGALTTLALGGFANTLSIIGSMSIAAAAEPLGMLADSIVKWKDVTVPSNLGDNLTALGNGISAFTFAGLGAGAISGVAVPLGELADSVVKWKDVIVPEGVAKSLGDLAEGVNRFTFSGLGSGAINGVGQSLGNLADSIKKWDGLTIPDTLSKSLGDLAEGVNRLTFSFAGGAALGGIAMPLGQLADSVKKWQGVSVPSDIANSFSLLATAIGKLWSDGLGAGVVSGIAAPLGTLADSIKKWEGLSIGDTMVSTMESISKLLGYLSSVDTTKLTDGTMQTAVDTITNLVNTINSISGIDLSSIDSLKEAVTKLGSVGGEGVAEGIQNGQTSITNAITALIEQTQSSFSTGLESIKAYALEFGTSISTEIANGLSSGFGNIDSLIQESTTALSTKVSSSISESLGSDLTAKITESLSGLPGVISTSIGDAMLAIETVAASFESIGSHIGGAMTKGIASTGTNTSNTISSILNESISLVHGSIGKFQTAGTTLGDNLARGFESVKSKVKLYISTALSSAASTAQTYYTNFTDIGRQLAQGMANGISESSYLVAAQASAMAAKAAASARAALDIHSPSRVFYKIGEYVVDGFVNAIDDNSNFVYSSMYGMSDNAASGMRKGIASINRLINSDMSTTPKITPILDLSDIQRGAGLISGMLGTNPISASLSRSVSIGAVDTNSQNDLGNKITSAINELKKTLSNGGNTYIIDGISYDDGSSVANAMESLIRAARIERRV